MRKIGFAAIPKASPEDSAGALYYGHFFCLVFHLDYLVRTGRDLHGVEDALHDALDARGIEYPAEHNVGHCYTAKPALKQFYRELDPTNSLNPGIGKTTKKKNWAEAS